MSDPNVSEAVEASGSACPSCGETTLPGASFCEACGADLAPASEPEVVVSSQPSCVSCQADGSEIVDDYCMQCGHKQPAPRDHMELDLGSVGAVTDKGKRHHHNEDAMAVDVGDAATVVVVCDGVSTTDNSDAASQAAADAARDVLVAAAAAGDDLVAAMGAATQAAQAVVLEVPTGLQGNASCTFVAAVVEPADSAGDTRVTVGWLGDSRAYWIGAGAQVLTTDHNWANDMIAAGVVPEAEARQHPQANTLTRWIGADASDVAPDTVVATVTGPGAILVCSDGLWNYAPDPAAMAALDAWQAPTPLTQAAVLTQFALDGGGHDNITVVVAAIDDPTTTGTAGDSDAADVVESPGEAVAADVESDHPAATTERKATDG